MGQRWPCLLGKGRGKGWGHRRAEELALDAGLAGKGAPCCPAPLLCGQVPGPPPGGGLASQTGTSGPCTVSGHLRVGRGDSGKVPGAQGQPLRVWALRNRKGDPASMP